MRARHGLDITCQLAHRYDKPLRKRLKEEWSEQMERMRLDISVQVMNMILEMQEHAAPDAFSKIDDASTVTSLSFESQVKLKLEGKAEERILNLTSVEAQHVARTQKPLSLSFELKGTSGSDGKSKGRTLRVLAAVNPVWADGIVTLLVPESAAFPLTLVVKLWDLPAEEQDADASVPMGQTEVSITHDAGRMHQTELSGDGRVAARGGDRATGVSFSYHMGTIVHTVKE